VILLCNYSTARSTTTHDDVSSTRPSVIDLITSPIRKHLLPSKRCRGGCSSPPPKKNRLGRPECFVNMLTFYGAGNWTERALGIEPLHTCLISRQQHRIEMIHHRRNDCRLRQDSDSAQLIDSDLSSLTRVFIFLCLFCAASCVINDDD